MSKGKPTRPRWLGDKIEASQRAATPLPCRKCGAPTLAGPSDDAQFWDAIVDAAPITALDEAIAYAQGRMTYDATRRGKETVLYVRRVDHMHGEARYPVHADHVCDGTGVDLDDITAVAGIQEGLFA